ncbi:MAG: glycosyltransferase, partial [Candidatus Binataceae bacterium]
WYRYALSRGGTLAVRAMLRPEAHDPLSGFFIMRREIYQRAEERDFAGSKILLAMLVRARPSNVAEAPIHFTNRTWGKSKLSPRLVVETIVSVTALRRPRR